MSHNLNEQGLAPSDQPISDVVETLEKTTCNDDAVLRDVISEFGSASFSSIILAVSLMLVSPLSGVPLFSSACGAVITLVAVQGAIGRSHLWLPDRLLSAHVGSRKTRNFFEYLMRIARWFDERTSSRMPLLVSPPASRVLYGICAIFGGILPLLELVPFSSSLIGGAIALVTAGLLARDGIVALAGLAVLPVGALVPILTITAVAN